MTATAPTWTPDRIEELKRLFDAEYTCSQIAREIGVTRNAVIGKLSRLGLSLIAATCSFDMHHVGYTSRPCVER